MIDPHTANHGGPPLGWQVERLTLTGAGDHRPRITRIGPVDAAATIVYLHGPLSHSGRFAWVAAELESRLGGRIGQLSYEQRGHAADSNGVATMPRLLDDLDLALAQATGEVVLVVQSLAAIVLQEWLYRHRRDPRLNIAAIIAVSPVTELPDPAGGFDRIPRTLGRHYGDRMIGELSGELGTRALWLGPHRIEAARRLLRTYRRRTAELAVVEDLLRATPTWLLAGEQDPIVSPAAVGELAERVWAEHETIPAARHDLAGSHPAAVTDAIVDALRVAHEAGRYGERRC